MKPVDMRIVGWDGASTRKMAHLELEVAGKKVRASLSYKQLGELRATKKKFGQIVDYAETREVDPVYEPGTKKLLHLTPVPGSERATITFKVSGRKFKANVEYADFEAHVFPIIVENSEVEWKAFCEKNPNWADLIRTT